MIHIHRYIYSCAYLYVSVDNSVSFICLFDHSFDEEASIAQHVFEEISKHHGICDLGDHVK